MRRVPRDARSPDAGFEDYETGLADLQEILSRSARASVHDSPERQHDRLHRDPLYHAAADDDHADHRLPAPYFLDDRAYGGEARDVDWPLRRRRSLSSRLLMVTLAAAGLAVLFALFTSDVTRAVLAGARSSVGGLAANALAPAGPESSPLTASDLQLKEPGRPSSQLRSPGSLESFAGAALAAPRPEPASPGLAASLAPAVDRDAPAGSAGNPVPPMRKLSAEEIATLMRLARVMIATGDVPAARLLLESAAGSQHADAALLLAQSYDPRPADRDAPRGKPDPQLAQTWYERAAQMGSVEAKRRLAQLRADPAAAAVGLQAQGRPVPPARIAPRKATTVPAQTPAQGKH